LSDFTMMIMSPYKTIFLKITIWIGKGGIERKSYWHSKTNNKDMPKSNLYPKTFIGCKWRQREKLEKTLSLAKASLATMTCLKVRWTLY
jgi:hypothetical protein